MSTTVLDASAVLAWIFDESGSDLVDSHLDGGHLSAVNLAEVLYRCDEEGVKTAGLVDELIELGVVVQPFALTEAEAVQEVRRRSRATGTRISLADACCLATALRLGGQALVSDAALEKLDIGVAVIPFR